MALCISLTFAFDASAAKRFGGGKSFGAAPSHQTRQAPQQRNDATLQQQAGRQQPAASGASRWLGPLAGIAAGGLLASMFMGDGFEGLQFLDILIFGLLAFVLFRFLAARRRQQPAMAAPGHAPMQREMPQQPSIFGGSAAPAAPVINAPAWFNEQSFLAAAREHFLALQQHWDTRRARARRWRPMTCRTARLTISPRSPSSSPLSCWRFSSRSAPRSVTPTSRPTSMICRSVSTVSTIRPTRRWRP